MIYKRRIEISEVNKMIDDIISIEEKWDGLDETTRATLRNGFELGSRPEYLMKTLYIVLHDCLEILEEVRESESL